MIAPHGGTVVEWLVEDGDPVSPGQPLLRLHPEGGPHDRLTTADRRPRTRAILGVGGYRPVARRHQRRDHRDHRLHRRVDPQRSGIVPRRWAAEDETVLMMSVAAAREALAQRRHRRRPDRRVIVATVSHLLQTPAVATAIAHQLGTASAAAFDISAACAGFCHGVSLANDMVRAGTARHVLVIGVERLSDLTDRDDRGTAFIFGDGAGAVVVGPTDEPASARSSGAPTASSGT